jgi:hypothetical protein
MKHFKVIQLIIIYLSLLLILNYVNNGIIFSKVEENEFIFQDFFIYNFIFNTILFFIKISFIGLIVLCSCLLFNIKASYKNIIKAIVLSNFVYFLRYFCVFIWSFLNWGTYTSYVF